MCLIGSNAYAERMQSVSFDEVLQMYRMSTSELESKLQNPVCDPKTLVDMLRQAYETMKEILAANDHVTFCR